MAQRFYNLVLLPRVRDDISEYKRLNFHLYQALRKALFKPGGFMKGLFSFKEFRKPQLYQVFQEYFCRCLKVETARYAKP